MSIRLLMIDDHALFRELAARILSGEPDMQVVGQCDSMEEALDVMDRVSPDLILLDYDLRGRPGTEFLRAARDRGYAGKVLMVCAILPDEDLQICSAEGLNGVFLKEQPLKTLLAAIRAVAEGRSWFDERQQKAILRSRAKSAVVELTVRELEILRAVLDGLSNKQISGLLDVPETTVKAGMQRLFEKTGVRTRASLVRVALEKYRHIVN